METMKLLTRPARLCTVLLLLTAAAAPSRGEAVIPNSGKECAICHIRWVEEFEQSKAQKARMDDVFKRQAGSGDMCLSCHDGSVVDSRFKVWSTRHHTTGSVPPPTVHIPTDIFPLDAQGRMTCATCHTAHAVAQSSDLRTVIFLRRPNVDSSLCLFCHSDHAQKSPIQHPLGRVSFPIPQEILDAGGKTAEDGRTVICQTCHEPHGARNPWMLVLPPSKLCIACHTDKSPETAPPAGAPMHHIGEAYPGFKPPASLVKAKATFGPNGELSCLSCHRLHDASGARPLLIQKNEDSSLCLECHTKQKSVLGSPHDLRLSSPQTVNASGQTAAESGPCGACHRIHGWARDVPDTHRPHSSGCMECHQSGGPASHDRLYVDAHTVGTPLPDGMATPLPLDKATGRIGCLTCHDPHSPRMAETNVAAPPPRKPGRHHPRIVMPSPPANTEVQEPRSFLRREGSQLCVLCHSKLPDLLSQPHDPTQFTPATRRMLALYPSIGPCRVCHTTHSARGPYLWAHTPAIGAGRIANLCGACHDDKLGIEGSAHDPGTAEWAKKLGFVSKGACIDCHPVHDPNKPPGIWGVVGPAQHNGARSCETCHRAGGPGKAMETAHIGKTVPTGVGTLLEKMVLGPGRKIVCATCHDIHQNSQDSKSLVASVTRLCGTCHPGKLGIQGSVHDPGAADWAKKLNFVSQGSCIDCHPIHGPKGKGGIWPSIGGGDTMTQSCQTCHRAGAPGPAVRTPHLAKSLGAAPESLPANMLVSPDRHIQCTTCHDIHQAQQNPKLLALPRQHRKTSLAGDSGICLVCHSQAEGLIYTLHDLRTSAPDALNVRGETAAVSGPCGSCHLVHVDPNTGGVWAQDLPSRSSKIPPSSGPTSDLCTCCHRKGGCASTRVPKYMDHPDVALVNRTRPGQPDYMPTFDPLGKESQTGAISCLTCHDPHVRPSTLGVGSAVLPYRRMFLRPESGPSHEGHTTPQLCVACHGAETLWRFLYYHKEQRKPFSERALNATAVPTQ
jgi:predicted CXXCH cytochrome family protein